MKKLFLILLLLPTLVMAQGKWEKVIVPADELKGEEGGTVYSYNVEGVGSLIIWDWSYFQFRLVSDTSQFNIKTGYLQFSHSYYAGVTALIGIYDENDEMVDKIELWLDCEDNHGNRFVRTRDLGGMLNPVGQKGKVKKLFKALQSNSGYVRIVAERFNTTDFDIKISPYKE